MPRRVTSKQPVKSSKTGGGKGSGKGGGVPREPKEPGKRDGDCVYAGDTYSEGAVIDQGGAKQRCKDGKWEDADSPEVKDYGGEDRPGNK